ncbi:CvpA family protein [Desulfotruncus alcoholivorax]|uniref:CvpA family protein n=1 Tax=Desulfotruncus alcoholivorax TaxID=265477 RepID=UPI00041DBCFF|nr:CvpA family protein [Desulfotruncus alcoholivorax]
MNWLDWIFVIILMVSGWQGLNKGLIHSMSRLIGIIVGLVVAFTWYKSLANYLDLQLGWGSSVSAFFLEKIPVSLLEQFNQKISVLDLLLSPFSSQQQSPVLQFDTPGNIQSMVNYLSTTLLEVISFIGLLFGCLIIIKIVLRIVSGAVTKTFLSPLDHVGGLVMGLARGVLIILILVLLARPLITNGDAEISGEQSFVKRGIAGSKIYPYATELLRTFNLSIPARPVHDIK